MNTVSAGVETISNIVASTAQEDLVKMLIFVYAEEIESIRPTGSSSGLVLLS